MSKGRFDKKRKKIRLRRFGFRNPHKKKELKFQIVRARFPRLREGSKNFFLFEFLRYLREKYPPPYYNPYTDGSTNTSEVVIAWCCRMHTDELRLKCKHHGLSSDGHKFDLIKRMYLHYRSGKLSLGYPYTAYGPEHERVNPPNCVCGKVKAIIKKRFPRHQIRFPRKPRFPRLPLSMRLQNPDWLKQCIKDFEKCAGRKLSRYEILFIS